METKWKFFSSITHPVNPRPVVTLHQMLALTFRVFHILSLPQSEKNCWEILRKTFLLFPTLVIIYFYISQQVIKNDISNANTL